MHSIPDNLRASEYPVCLELYSGSVAQLDPCLHRFHEDCVKQLSELGSTICPMCRQSFEGHKIVELDSIEANKIQEFLNSSKPDLSLARKNGIPFFPILSQVAGLFSSLTKLNLQGSFCLPPNDWLQPLNRIDKKNEDIDIDELKASGLAFFENGDYSGALEIFKQIAINNSSDELAKDMLSQIETIIAMNYSS